MTEYFNKINGDINSQKFEEDLFSFLEHVFSKEEIADDCYNHLRNMNGIMNTLSFIMKTKKPANIKLSLEIVVYASESIAEAEIVLKKYCSFIEKKKKQHMKEMIQSIQQKTVSFTHLLLPLTHNYRNKKWT